MPKPTRKVFFAIRKDVVDDLTATIVVDMLRYESARPLSNTPTGWYVFEKAVDNPVTLARLNSFTIPDSAVRQYRAAVDSRGSCPWEFREHLEQESEVTSV